MKITLEKAMEALSEFMGEQVDTIHDPVKRSVGLFVVGALRKNPEGLMSKARSWLEMSGVVSDNMVDLDVFKAGLDNIFANEQKVSYLGFGINEGEAANLVKKMMSKAQAATVTVTEVE